MIDRSRVIDMLALYWDIDKSNAMLLPLCNAEVALAETMIKEGVNPDDVRIINLVAAAVYLRLCRKASSVNEGVEVFKAGDVTLHLDPEITLKSAENEYGRAVEKAALLLKDDRFFFSGVSA